MTNQTIYESITAVAELNAVKGFNPLSFLRKASYKGQEHLYLDLKYKKLWFRLKHPGGVIRVSPLKITEQIAIIEAKVFFNKDDLTPITSFIAQRQAGSGNLYVQSAQYAAIDTALSDAGFGIQFSDVCDGLDQELYSLENEDNSTKQANNMPLTTPAEEKSLAKVENLPVNANVATATAIKTVDSAAETVDQETSPPTKEEKAIEQKTMANQTVQPKIEPTLKQVASTITEQPIKQVIAEQPVKEQPAQEQAGESPNQEQAIQLSSDMDVDSLCAIMSLEDAQNIIVDVGTCSGWTLGQVAERRMASLKWYLNGYPGENNLIRAGAKILLANLNTATA